jgi:hypothetical protein
MRGSVGSFYDTTDNRLARSDLQDRDAAKAYRLVTAEDLRDRQRVVSSVFYSFSALQLSQWCLVDVDTAARWKRGEEDPSPQALQLFKLHRDGRVLGPEWEGWRAIGGKIFDPEDQGTTPPQLRAYAQVYALCHKLMEGNEAALAEFAKAMELAG